MSKPTIIAVATYPDLESADAGADKVMALHHEHALGHVATAIVIRGAHGDLEIHRRDTSARHLALGGALIGATLGLIAPPLGAVAMAGAAGVAGTTAVMEATVLAGAGGIIGHLWKAVPKSDVKELGALLDTCQAALVAIAIDKGSADVESALADAESLCVKHVADGDVEAAFHAAADAVTGGSTAG